MYVDGNDVVMRGLLEGTHEGEFLGIPATGTEVSTGSAIRYTIENGQIVDFWFLPDALDLMTQLGMALQPTSTVSQ